VEEAFMKKKKIIVLLLIAVGISTGLFFGFRSPKDNPNQLTVYGNVDIREVDLGFRVFGKVKTLFFEEGDLVKKGDLLAELDPVTYEEQLLEAKAELVYAETNYVNAKKQFERRKTAVITSAISEEDYENSASNMQEKEAIFERAKASLASAITTVGDTLLFAPNDGVLLSRIREPGSVLNAGQPVYSLSLLSPIWIRAYVSEVDLGRVYPGMEAEVITDTPSSPIYKGSIGFISPVAEFTPKNVETVGLRTELVYRIRVIIGDPDKGLRQGMPVTVILKDEKDHGR
jgi:HlyD family secretion protein